MNLSEQATKKWLLTRLLSARSDIQLVLNHVDEIGKELVAALAFGGRPR
jgi:hypothetical protein